MGVVGLLAAIDASSSGRLVSPASMKGVGIGHVTSAWGLWLFTACVLASIWVSWATKSALGKEPSSPRS